MEDAIATMMKKHVHLEELLSQARLEAEAASEKSKKAIPSEST